MHRVVILGTSGAGKSTLARALGEAEGLLHIDLDDLTTGTYPPVTGEAFVDRVRELVTGSDWIIDGDYERRLGDLVLSRAELAIWLDLPLRVSLARMWRRTFNDVRSEARHLHPSLARWVAHEIRSHIRRRFTMQKRLAAHPVLSVVHLRTQREVDAWLASRAGNRLG
jgi:adenylate kinase family enzyme